MTCYITISEESNFGPNRRVAGFAPGTPSCGLLKLESTKHILKVLRIGCIKLIIECCYFNNIGLSLVYGRVHFDTLRLTTGLIVGGLIEPVFTTDGCV